MQPVLLFRTELASQYELQYAEKYFPIEVSRVNCRNCLVIGRYSVIPFYGELERDLQIVGSQLVNSLEQHCWITSFGYYNDVRQFTPETWTDDNIHTCRWKGPFVVKGKMSSKKHDWATGMYAETKREALDLASRLKKDSDIREQGVVYRKFVPLRTYEYGVNGLPYTNEWRFFYYRQNRLSYGYYWSAADCLDQARLDPDGIALADLIAAIVGKRASFFTLDVAETENGEWILIEINDGQAAVPSENDLDELYGNLRAQFD